MKNHFVRWSFRIAGLLLAATVYGIWKLVDRQLGWGLESALLRGAIVFGFLIWMWRATSFDKDLAVNDREFYEIVAKELDNESIDKGLWTKCFADAIGNESVTRANYIKARVSSLTRAQQQAIRRERPTPGSHIRCPDCRQLIPKASEVCRCCNCKLVAQ